MKHVIARLVIAGLAFAGAPVLAAAPPPCTPAELSDTYTPDSFLVMSHDKAPDGSPDLLKDKTLIGYFDVPVLKYPYGSLKTYGVSVSLIIGVDGRVRCASLASLRGREVPVMTEQRKALLEATSQWRFEPFTLDGEAIPVGFDMISFEEELPAKHVDMPAGDPAQMTIAYDRDTGAYGRSVHVELHGDGTAFFRQTDPVDALGPQTYQVDAHAVQGLLNAARDADFWSVRDLYPEVPAYFPSTFSRISITIGGVTKTVTGYDATDAGEPQAVRKLDLMIEKAANLGFWEAPTQATLDRLKGQGFDFTSARAGRLLKDWVADGSIPEAVPLALMDMGAPIDGGKYAPDTGPALLVSALDAGRVEVARRLIDKGFLRGADGKPDADKVNAAFIAAIGSAEIGAVDLIAPFHPDLTFQNQWQPLQRMSVLFKLKDVDPYPRPNLVPLAERLVEMGADVNARDANGATPLMWSDDAALALFFIDHGADVNAVAEDGTPVLATISDQDIALLLLTHGADPRKGKAAPILREHIRVQRWHRVKAWLEGHGYADLLVAQPGDRDALQDMY